MFDTNISMQDLQIEKAKLLGSFLYFVKKFYWLKHRREFIISKPSGCESHFVTFAKVFTKVLNCDPDYQYSMINAMPGSSKSEMLKMFVAWALAHFPFAKFLYISYNIELATEHTEDIKETISLPAYETMFGIKLNSSIRSKDHFETKDGGAVKAFGSNGGITGYDAGLPGVSGFSGAIIMDDIHKASEIYSDATRERIIKNYKTSILSRQRNPRVPILVGGQRLDQRDLYGRLIANDDGNKWNITKIQGLDPAGNAIYPEVYPKEKLLIMKEKNPDLYWPQIQQEPLNPGGTIFQRSWFHTLTTEPEMLATFITGDTAETDKNYNDPTVFSFWGLYKVVQMGIETDIYAVHWIDCWQMYIEPKDLKDKFLQFYSSCLRHKVQPTMAAIEKKSTGVTLLSTLEGFAGLQIVDIERTKASGSKTARFLEIQPIIETNRMTLPAYGRHTEECINECSLVTKNNTHTHDDRCDTLYDAVKIALLDELVLRRLPLNSSKNDKKVRDLSLAYKKINQARRNAYGNG